MKTFTQLQKGDFIWRVKTSDNNVVLQFVYLVESSILRTGCNKFEFICKPLNYTNYISSLYLTILNDTADKSFIYEHNENDVLFTNQSVFEKYVKLKKMEISNKQKETQESKIADLEAAINGASEFLKKKLNSINEVR